MIFLTTFSFYCSSCACFMDRCFSWFWKAILLVIWQGKHYMFYHVISWNRYDSDVSVTVSSPKTINIYC